MTATEMKPRMTAGLFCVCSMALQPSLYVAGWNPLPGLVMPVASGWQQPAAHRRVAQTALTRVGGPEIRAVRMSTPTICMRLPGLGLTGNFLRSRRFSGALWVRHLAALGEDRSASFGS